MSVKLSSTMSPLVVDDDQDQVTNSGVCLDNRQAQSLCRQAAKQQFVPLGHRIVVAITQGGRNGPPTSVFGCLALHHWGNLGVNAAVDAFQQCGSLGAKLDPFNLGRVRLAIRGIAQTEAHVLKWRERRRGGCDQWREERTSCCDPLRASRRS